MNKNLLYLNRFFIPSASMRRNFPYNPRHRENIKLRETRNWLKEMESFYINDNSSFYRRALFVENYYLSNIFLCYPDVSVGLWRKSWWKKKVVNVVFNSQVYSMARCGVGRENEVGLKKKEKIDYKIGKW